MSQKRFKATRKEPASLVVPVEQGEESGRLSHPVSKKFGKRDKDKRQMGRCRGAYGTMAGIASGRGGGHARQSQYSAAVKSGVNSQKSLLNSVQVPIPISKVRYHKDASGGVTTKSNRPSMKAHRGYYETVPGLLCK